MAHSATDKRSGEVYGPTAFLDRSARVSEYSLALASGLLLVPCAWAGRWELYSEVCEVLRVRAKPPVGRSIRPDHRDPMLDTDRLVHMDRPENGRVRGKLLWR